MYNSLNGAEILATVDNIHYVIGNSDGFDFIEIFGVGI